MTVCKLRTKKDWKDCFKLIENRAENFKLCYFDEKPAEFPCLAIYDIKLELGAIHVCFIFLYKNDVKFLR